MYNEISAALGLVLLTLQRQRVGQSVLVLIPFQGVLYTLHRSGQRGKEGREEGRPL